jgi:hypothetical protein
VKKRTRMIMAGVIVGVIVCAAATATALASSDKHANGGEEPSVATGAAVPSAPETVGEPTTLSEPSPDATGETTDPADEAADDTDQDGDGTSKPHPFGQHVSALRHAGDHTPAAELQGKDVPGHEVEDEAVDEDDDGAAEPDDGDTEGEGEHGKKDKEHVLAAVEKGKTVPGWSER